MDKRKPEAFFYFNSALCLKIQFLTVITWNYVGELWAYYCCSQRAFSYCTEHTLLLFQSIFRFSLLPVSLRAMQQILWLGNIVSFPTQRSQLIIQRERIHKHTVLKGGYIGGYVFSVLCKHSETLVTPDSSSPLLGIKHSTWPTRHVTRKKKLCLFLFPLNAVEVGVE